MQIYNEKVKIKVFELKMQKTFHIKYIESNAVGYIIKKQISV